MIQLIVCLPLIFLLIFSNISSLWVNKIWYYQIPELSMSTRSSKNITNLTNSNIVSSVLFGIHHVVQKCDMKMWATYTVITTINCFKSSDDDVRTTENVKTRIFTHLKLCLADAIHNFKWVKIYVKPSEPEKLLMKNIQLKDCRLWRLY